jgi:RHS repeat-associated protein
MNQRLAAVLIAALVASLPVTFAAELHLTYDANGNLVTGDGKYRVYNSLNQLSAIYNGSGANGTLLETYTYHPTEERILQKKAYTPDGTVRETTLYLSQSFVRVMNASGTFDFTYVYHEGQLVAQRNPDGSQLYVHGNHQGSTAVVTNATRAVIERTEYTPTGGIVTGGNATRYGYTGKEYDSIVGDTDMNARRYEESWGLFTKPDGVIAEAANPQQLNRYSYALNNPYKYIDPDGHEVRVVEENGQQVVYRNDARIGTIVDGSEQVTAQTYTAVINGQQGGTITATSYDYTVQMDTDPMRTDYLTAAKTRSLNDITWDDLQDPLRKENVERGWYAAQPLIGGVGKVFPAIGKASNYASGVEASYDFVTGNKVGLLKDAANFWLPSSAVLNSVEIATYQSQGRQLGDRIVGSSSYTTSNGATTTAAKYGKLTGGGSYMISKPHAPTYAKKR